MMGNSRLVVACLAIAATFFIGLTGSAWALELRSRDIRAGEPIEQKFAYDSLGCAGQNISPELSWSNAPEGAKSFAVVVDDPDAPTGGSGFTHWIVADIPVSVSILQQGAGTADGKRLPPGSVQFENDFGDVGWGGPCPPPRRGAHRYNFTVYALSIEHFGIPAPPGPAWPDRLSTRTPSLKRAFPAAMAGDQGRLNRNLLGQVNRAEEAAARLRAFPRFGNEDRLFLVCCQSCDSAASSFFMVKARLESLRGISGRVLDDIRRTVSAGKIALGHPCQTVERILSHVIPGVRGACNRHK